MRHTMSRSMGYRTFHGMDEVLMFRKFVVFSGDVHRKSPPIVLLTDRRIHHTHHL